MLSQIPYDFENMKKEEIDKEVLRVAIVAELDAINLYEQLAAMTDSVELKKVFFDVAKEEKTHLGEFHALLLRNDLEQVEELEKGKKEVQELIVE